MSLVLWTHGCRMPRWLVQWAHPSTPAAALAGIITLSRKHLQKTPAFWMRWPIFRCTCHPSCLQRRGYICCSLLETRCSTCQNSINLSCTYYYACTNRWCGRDSNPSLQQLLCQKVQTALDYYLFHQTHMPQQNVLAAGHLDPGLPQAPTRSSKEEATLTDNNNPPPLFLHLLQEKITFLR